MNRHSFSDGGIDLVVVYPLALAITTNYLSSLIFSISFDPKHPFARQNTHVRLFKHFFLDGSEEIFRRLIKLRSINRGYVYSREFVSRFVIIRTIKEIIQIVINRCFIFLVLQSR